MLRSVALFDAPLGIDDLVAEATSEIDGPVTAARNRPSPRAGPRSIQIIEGGSQQYRIVSAESRARFDARRSPYGAPRGAGVVTPAMRALSDDHEARSQFRSARRAVQEAWRGSMVDPEALASLPVTAATSGAAPSTGSQPQHVLEDAVGRRYLFKLAPSEQIAAEVFAGGVRALGRQLHVPAARRTLVLDGTPRVGLLQPRVDVVGALPKDPRQWTAVQCESILRDHPWEWIVGNLDTHIDQYVLVGEHGLPINIDWDRSLLDLEGDAPTRFDRRSATIVPAHNHLYAEYVAGRVELDLFGMRREAHRIAAIPFAQLLDLLDAWAVETQAPPELRRRVTDRLRQRHGSIARAFDDFAAGLEHERDQIRHTTQPVGRRVISGVRDAWQRLVLLVVHDRIVRPALRLRRWIVRRLADARP